MHGHGNYFRYLIIAFKRKKHVINYKELIVEYLELEYIMMN